MLWLLPVAVAAALLLLALDRPPVVAPDLPGDDAPADAGRDLREGVVAAAPSVFAGRIVGKVSRGGEGVEADIGLELHVNFDGRENRETRTDALGRFDLGGLPPGGHRITVTAGEVRVVRDLLLPAGPDPLELDFFLPAEGHTLCGIARFEDGRPYRGAIEVAREGVADRHIVDTAADGAFRFVGLPAGWARLRARTNERLEEDGPRVRIPVQEEVLFIIGQGTRELAGTVLARDTGAPITGARVESGGDSPQGGRVRRFCTVTGGDGRFALPVPVSDERISRLMVEAEGHWPWRLDGFRWREEIEVVLERSARLTVGVVSAEDGRPVPGVPVTAYFGRLPDVNDTAIRLSDPEGRVVFSSIPSRGVTLDVRGNGFRLDYEEVPVESRRVDLDPGESREVELPVVRSATIRGRITTAAGEAADGAWLVLVGERGSHGRECVSGGTFSLVDLLPGSYSLEAGFASRCSTTVDVRVGPGQVCTVDLSLPAGAWVEAELVAADGSGPIPGAQLNVGSIISRPTDESGRARLGPVSAGKWHVWARVAGFLRVDRDVELREGETTPVTLALERGLSISGRVVLPDGSPAPDCTVSSRRDYSNDEQRVLTVPDGTFDLRGLPDGDLKIVATLTGGFECRTTLPAGTSGVVLALERKRAEPRRTVELIVRDSSGNPVPRADWSAGGRTADGDAWEESGEIVEGRGQLRLRGTEADLGVWVSGARRPTSFPLPLGAARFGPVTADRESIEIVLPPERVITGLVRGPDGQGVPRVAIWAELERWPGAAPEEGGRRAVLTDSDGTFRIGGLPAGEVTIRVEPPDGLAPVEPTRVAAGERDVVVTLDTFADVVVTLLDPQGRPVPHVWVGARLEVGGVQPWDREWYWAGDSGLSGEDGRLRMTVLIRSLAYVLLCRAVYANAGLAPVRIDGWLPRDTTITLEPENRLAGRVTRPDGTAVGTEEGGLWAWNRVTGWDSIPVNSDGSFETRGLPAGPVALTWIPPEDPVQEPTAEPARIGRLITWVSAGDREVRLAVPGR